MYNVDVDVAFFVVLITISEILLACYGFSYTPRLGTEKIDMYNILYN
jgi:hypothetical protein